MAKKTTKNDSYREKRGKGREKMNKKCYKTFDKSQNATSRKKNSGETFLTFFCTTYPMPVRKTLINNLREHTLRNRKDQSSYNLHQ